ncbi:MAG TPA: SRPBCC domain-containing protein [Polyangiaceae bacterium]
MKIDIDESSVTEPVIVMSRMFDAPREVVWAAFTDPKHVVNWYGGHGFSNPVCEMDVRPGGRWHHVMRTPDGTEYASDYVFVEVVKPEKISWQHVDHGKRTSGPPTCLNVVTFEEHGRRTKWRLVARFESMADRDRAKKMGFSGTIAEGAERLNDVATNLL